MKINSQFILDASVGAKWIFKDEELSDKAALFLLRSEQNLISIVVPEFFYSELANICWVNVRKNSAKVRQVTEALDKIMSLPFHAYSDKELSDVALENAFRFNISVYDGAYLALAEVYCAPVVTADDKLFNACHKRFDFIESLRDIDLV